MKTTELEDQFSARINEAILKANAGEKICECGQVILDRNKTLAVLTEIVEIALTRLAAFTIVAEERDVRLHVPDPGKPDKPNLH